MAIDVEYLIDQINQLAPPERLRILAEVSAAMSQQSRHDELEALSRWSRSRPTLDQMARTQGVKPVVSLDELASKAWPQDEPADAFLDWMRQQRRRDVKQEEEP